MFYNIIGIAPYIKILRKGVEFAMLRKFCSAFWESSKEMLVFLLKLSVVFCVFCGPVLMLMLLAIWALQPSTEAMMIILAVMMISLEVACNDKSGRVSRINKYLTKKGQESGFLDWLFGE